MARVQVNDIPQGPGLQAVASPVDTYVRPRVQPSDFERLASSLSSITPELQQWAEKRTAEDNAGYEAQAEKRLAGLTFEEQQKLSAEGKLAEMDQPFYLAALNKGYGTNLARQRRDDFLRRASGENTASDGTDNTIDLTTANVDQMLAEQAKQDLNGVKDRFQIAGYTSVMDEVRNTLLGEKAKARVAQAHTTALDTATGNFAEIYQRGVAANMAPDAIYAQMRATYQSNKDLLHLTFPEQDAIMFDIARRAAGNGDVGMVNEIATNDRDGVGALGNKRDYVDKFVTLMNEATTNNGKAAAHAAFEDIVTYNDQANQGILDETKFAEFRKTNPGVFSDAQASSLIEQSRAAFRTKQDQLAKSAEKATMQVASEQQMGSITASLVNLGNTGGLQYITDGAIHYTDKEGNDKTLTQKEAWAKARDAFLNPPNGNPPDFDTQVAWLSKNSLTNPMWENLLSSGPMAASAPSLTAQNLPKPLTDGYALYKNLREQNRLFLGAHIHDDAAKNFWETARISEQYLGMSQPDALLNAVTVMKQQGEDIPYTMRPSFEKLKSKLDDISEDKDGWLWPEFLGGDKSIKNLGTISGDLETLASHYIRSGLDTDSALREAKDRITEKYQPVNGWLVPTSDQTLPPDFAKLATQYVADFKKESDKSDTPVPFDAGELSIRPIGNGAWVVISTTDGQPVLGPLNGAKVFTTKDLTALEDQNKAKEIASHLKWINDEPMALPGVFDPMTNKPFMVKPRTLERNFATTIKNILESSQVGSTSGLKPGQSLHSYWFGTPDPPKENPQ